MRKIASPSSSTLQSCLLTAAVISLCSAQAPAPLPVPAADTFLGFDGLWSPVTIRVGTPAQWLSVLPNTLSQETWVVGPGGCDGTFTCQEERGGIFLEEQSSTFADEGYYALNFEPELGDSGSANYGLDSIAVNDQVEVAGQIVGIINSTSWWLGELGLGVQQTRFLDETNQRTFLSSLVENASVIPSHSFGYTAGAYYRLQNVPASLTLGGVDTNRFTNNDVTFTLAPDQSPGVAINQVSVSANPYSSSDGPTWASNPLTFFDSSEADLFTIDSSTPFLWFPEQVCDRMADAFDLTYNDTLGLYFFDGNVTSPEVLSNWNMIFTFTLGNPAGGNQLEITLPYDAFNLQLSYPFPLLDANFTSPPVNYFPLRKATGPDQYTLGRAFLQETYLSVDYERNNFSISQAKFSPDALTNINLEPITRPAHSNYTGPAIQASTHAGLSTGAKAGIGVAIAVLAVGITGVCCYFFIFRKKRGKSEHEREMRQGSSVRKDNVSPSEDSFSGLPMDTCQPFNELPASRRHPIEVPSDASHSRFEMPGSIPIEMPAGEVPAAYYSSPTSTIHPQHHPRSLAELGEARRNSTLKYASDWPLQTERPSSPVPPPYSNASIDERPSPIANVSPNTLRHSGAYGTHTTTSSDGIISPVSNDSTSSPQSRQGTTRSKSKGVFSPLSPLAAALPGARSQSRTGLERTGSGAALIPTPQQPSRVSSRSSRFHEDMDDMDGQGGVELSERAPQVRPSSRAGLERFSWEDPR